MEIECPPYAVALWIEGDNFAIRFPDQHFITIPLKEPARLVSILAARRGGRPRAIGTKACPTQWDIEQWLKDHQLVERDDALLEELNL